MPFHVYKIKMFLTPNFVAKLTFIKVKTVPISVTLYSKHRGQPPLSFGTFMACQIAITKNLQHNPSSSQITFLGQKSGNLGQYTVKRGCSWG